jgi:hypothetical protein
MSEVSTTQSAVDAITIEEKAFFFEAINRALQPVALPLDEEKFFYMKDLVKAMRFNLHKQKLMEDR